MFILVQCVWLRIEAISPDLLGGLLSSRRCTDGRITLHQSGGSHDAEAPRRPDADAHGDPSPRGSRQQAPAKKLVPTAARSALHRRIQTWPSDGDHRLSRARGADVLSALLQKGYLVSDSERGAAKLGFRLRWLEGGCRGLVVGTP